MPQENTHIIDQQLLRQVALGDQAAFRQVFEQYKVRFYAAAVKMTRSENIAEEVVQEVFVTLWLKRSQLAVVEKPATYLFTMLYNSIYAHFNKIASEKRMKLVVEQQATAWEASAEKSLLDKENKILLHNIIEQLPPQQQLIYKLKQDGHSRQEIASQLQISPHTVKNHLQEALKFIRTRLGTIEMGLLLCWIIY